MQHQGSDFNPTCVANLNELLERGDFDIWLSSSRRFSKEVAQWSVVFDNRGIAQPVVGVLPEYPDCANRAEEIERFVVHDAGKAFLVIDDDKSLDDLAPATTIRVVQTMFMSGFDASKLKEALRFVSQL